MDEILHVKDLEVSFYTHIGEIQAIRGVDFVVKDGETVAIVGESGCGKSVTAKSIMKLLPSPPVKYKKGSILFKGKDLLGATEREMQQIRGKEISMIFQDPMTSLNPTSKIGQQIMETIMRHQIINRKEAFQQALNLLELVGIPQPEKRINQYPHEYSGGMRQRAMIAIALACNPSLIIADEPTTALDVTIQAQILELLKSIQQKMGTSIILITHDLGVVAEICDRVVVMYAGKVVETGTVNELFLNPQHPYTKGLLQSAPRLNMDKKQPLTPIIGTPPDLIDPPKGCPFYGRCSDAMKICQSHQPDVEKISNHHFVSCWLQHPIAKRLKERQT